MTIKGVPFFHFKIFHKIFVKKKSKKTNANGIKKKDGKLFFFKKCICISFLDFFPQKPYETLQNEKKNTGLIVILGK